MLASADEALRLRRGTFSVDTFVAYGAKFEALLGLGDLEELARAVDGFAQDFDSSPIHAVPFHRATRLATTYYATVTLALLRGDFVEVERAIAAADADEAETAVHIGFRLTVEFGWTQMAYFRGDWACATEGWARTSAVVPGALDVYFGFAGIGCPLAELRSYLDAWFQIDASGPDVTKASNVAVVAEALRRLGDRDGSAAYGERFTGHSGFLLTNTMLYCHGPYDTALGILFTTAGQLDRAVGYLEAGVARCESIGSPSFGAIAQLELATTLRLRDAPGDAVRSAALTEAVHRTTTELGMYGWTRRAERLAAGDLEPWRIESDA